MIDFLSFQSRHCSTQLKKYSISETLNVLIYQARNVANKTSNKFFIAH
jgi:hypothetical protein